MCARPFRLSGKGQKQVSEQQLNGRGERKKLGRETAAEVATSAAALSLETFRIKKKEDDAAVT